MEKKTYYELKRNTLIIGISNLGSKAIGFILAPLYSFYMTTSQYGVMDLITTTASLVLPFICFGIYEGTFRYASEKSCNEKAVFTTSLGFCLLGTASILIIIFILAQFVNIPQMVFISIIYAILDVYFTTLTWFARGRGKMITFSFSGILNAIILLIFNVIFLVVFKLELRGWIISIFLAKVVVIIYLIITLKIWRIFSFSSIERKFTKEILKYCLPLIPSAGFWWIMNVSDRYAISYFLGVSANGIYAVSNKLPTILSIFESVFYQSWQTTAFKSADNEHKNLIFSEVFLNYFKALTVGVLGILIVLKPMVLFLFAKEYSIAWVGAAPLVIAVMLHALAGNLGTIYTVFKSTRGALKTSAIGAIVNTILNIIFIPIWGINAAAWTTVIGYIVVLFVRWHDSKKYLNLLLPTQKIIITVVLITIQFILYYVPGVVSYIIRFTIFGMFAYINRSMIFKLLTK